MAIDELFARINETYESKMSIFNDAKVLFTAADSPQGKSALLIESASRLIVTSDYAVNEA